MFPRARRKDYSVCQSGYSPSLSTTCTRYSPSRSQWLVVVAVVAVFIAVCAMVVFAVYLVPMKSQDQTGTHVVYAMLRGLPLEAFKNVVVVWQIVTRVRFATAIPL